MVSVGVAGGSYMKNGEAREREGGGRRAKWDWTARMSKSAKEEKRKQRKEQKRKSAEEARWVSGAGASKIACAPRLAGQMAL